MSLLDKKTGDTDDAIPTEVSLKSNNRLSSKEIKQQLIISDSNARTPLLNHKLKLLFRKYYKCAQTDTPWTTTTTKKVQKNNNQAGHHEKQRLNLSVSLVITGHSQC